MKNCYVALGGIAGSLLREHKINNKNADAKYLYFDTDCSAIESNADNFDFKYCFAPPYDYSFKDFKPFAGTGIAREVGKDLFKYSLYTDRIPDMVDDFFDDDIKFVFLTTTFGGFGSAVVYDLVEFINIQIKRKYQYHKIENIIIALSQNDFAYISDHLKKSFQLNTINFVSEYSYYGYRKSSFFPEIDLYVPDLSEMKAEDFYMIVDYSRSQLEKVDKKDSYLCEKKNEYDVFVSYSSKDQTIADKLVDAFKKVGIKTWIATENINAGSYAKQIVEGIRNSSIFAVITSENSIKSQHVLNEIDQAFKRLNDGITIMPFIADDAEMSDEYSYYLSRQESFLGNRPPIEQKIDEFVEVVQEKIKQKDRKYKGEL